MTAGTTPRVTNVTTHRLFFALWPDNDTRQLIRKNIKKVVQHGGGKRVPEENLHLTLSYLGSVDDATQRCVEQFADTLDFEPCFLEFDRLGYWPKPKVLWLGCSNKPDALTKFVYELNKGLKECGIDVGDRSFAPHITLMRKVNKSPQDTEIKKIPWKVDHFVLVESKTLPQGAQYQVMKTWPHIK